MSAGGTVYLMYHEIEVPGREVCQSEPGYLRYVVSAADFRKQMTLLQAGGLRGISVTQALERADNEGPAVAITFDDGCETDWTRAAPSLQQAGFHATFYVVAGFLGRRGYLSPGQLRELAQAGFEIGCHSRTHAYLPGLSPQELRAEMAEAKERLEQLLGRRVDHFSCPGGRWSPRVAAMARAAGYHSVATSRISTNTPGSDRYRLSRVVILRETPLRDFDRLCRAEGLFRLRVHQAALHAAKGLLGNSLYQKVRSAVLDHGRTRAS